MFLNKQTCEGIDFLSFHTVEVDCTNTRQLQEKLPGVFYADHPITGSIYLVWHMLKFHISKCSNHHQVVKDIIIMVATSFERSF